MMEPGPLPPAVAEAVGHLLGSRAQSARILSVTPVAGGCIHRAVRVETERGILFLKWSPKPSPGLFQGEADGLEALRDGMRGGDPGEGQARVPLVLGLSADEPSGPAWLALEWIEQGTPGAGAGERLAAALVQLHQPVSGGWGWSRDNHIGSLPQANPTAPSWGAFWRDARLEPFLRQARDAGAFGGSQARTGWERVLAGVEAWTRPGDEEGPSLLHGDLWSGNVYFTPAGDPVLVDPAVYRGHREVDLAMMELFGGFPAGTLRHYQALRPVPPGYPEVRRDLYQLYPLLVHVLLFGGGYEASALERVRRLAALV
jgi:fructosamine-3-kinase